MFFDPKIERYGVWILWMALLITGIGGEGCSSMPRAHSHRRGLLDMDRMPEQAAAPLPFAPRKSAERKPSSVAPESAPALQARETQARHRDLVEESHAAAMPRGFAWPLKNVQITSRFGRRARGPLHQGLDLRASVGTPVYSAHTGRVIYAGQRIAGYGKLVVIKDSRGYSTIYAHNSKLLVLPGQQVDRGQKIALSGATGTVRGAHLHFEVRQGVTPQDPEKLLSRR